jgi:glycosyltransferase involved in cell wall biosynthesis
MRIAVIVPAYNAEATIASALRSLLRQCEEADLHIIVVDDGSADRTSEVVQAIAATAPEIRLVERAHGGISKARNAGLRAIDAATDMVGFLDADDLSPKGRFARDAAVLEADPSFELVYAKIRFFEREDSA